MAMAGPYPESYDDDGNRLVQEWSVVIGMGRGNGSGTVEELAPEGKAAGRGVGVVVGTGGIAFGRASACVTKANCSGVRDASSAANAFWSIGSVAAILAIPGLRRWLTELVTGFMVGVGTGAGKTGKVGKGGKGGGVGTGAGERTLGLWRIEAGTGTGGEASFPLFNIQIPSK